MSDQNKLYSGYVIQAGSYKGEGGTLTVIGNSKAKTGQKCDAGVINVANIGTLALSGGTITDCAVSDHGTIVYNNGVFEIGGNGFAIGGDVYLADSKSISATSAISSLTNPISVGMAKPLQPTDAAVIDDATTAKLTISGTPKLFTETSRNIQINIPCDELNVTSSGALPTLYMSPKTARSKSAAQV